MMRGREGTTRAVHAWLDGEGSERAARRDPEAASQVELWKRLESQAARLRETRAPAGFTARILAALPAEVTPAKGAPASERDARHATHPAV